VALAAKDLTDKTYAVTHAIDAIDMYFSDRIMVMLRIVHPNAYFWCDRYQNEDDRMIFIQSGIEQDARFASIIVAEPGFLDWSEFDSLVVDSDEDEEKLLIALQTSTVALPRRASLAINGLVELYNDYGCPNVAIFDFFGILALDLRQCMPPSQRNIARASYVQFRENCEILGTWAEVKCKNTIEIEDRDIRTSEVVVQCH
jgi:hypothetical protein